MEFSSLPELESLIANLLTNQKCSCHFLNPTKTRILLWLEKKGNQTLYHLRIGIQKFISQEQLDRNGETYWRFGISEGGEPGHKSELPTQSELDPITKFNQRQAQVINHVNNPNPSQE